jgi:tRNA threonylcarbamoyladenosine biosynthesis protein TsaB
VIACLDARMGGVYYSALERTPMPGAPAWREAVAAVCVPPQQVPRPAGDGWIGCGSGFSVYRSELEAALGNALVGVRANSHPSAVAVARLAAPRLAAGEGVDAALAAPLYLRDKVALTTEERAAGSLLK